MASTRWLVRTALLTVISVLTLAAPAPRAAAGGPNAAAEGRPQGERRGRFAHIDRTAPLPPDLLRPEGRSRWDLRGAALGARFVRTLTPGSASITLRDETVAAPGSAADGTSDGTGAGEASMRVYTDPEEGAAALRYLMPDRAGDPLRPGLRWHGVLQESRAGGDGPGPADRLELESEIVGIGWAELPSGPREVVLERLLVLRQAGGRGPFAPDRLLHRFIDPRAGVVAEISGPAGADGRDRIALGDAYVLETVLAGAADLRLYVADLWDVPFEAIAYGWDRGSGTTVASLTPAPNISTIGDLVALPTWDFSGDTTGVTEVAATTTPINSQETCNTAQCGYGVSGGQLDRTDKDFSDPANTDKINAVLQLEEGTAATTVWLRAGSQHEGKTGSFGSGESRFCYSGTFVNAAGQTVARTPAPLWVMPHQDAPGAERYAQAGDAWSSAPFNCEQNIFNQVCGVAQTFDKLYSKACGTHTGTQSGQFLKAGVVTLPSGHTFNALVATTIADFCVYLTNGCSALFKVDEVRTVEYLWQVPRLGTVVRLQSVQNAADTTSFTTLAETDIKFGLFPPRSIAVQAVDDTTVSLSWDPGLDTHRISGYKVYWDTDSGAASPYAFDSVGAPGQVVFNGTGATISGLTPGTTYYFTVTSLSSYTDPSTLATTVYESLLYPTQVSGDPSFVYPVEVMATTTGGACVPAAEVSGLTVAHAAGGIQICWNPVSDPCLQGYDVLGAASPASPDGFGVIADAGLSTCWNGDPAASFFLVVARGSGGTGPWGAYGR
jgi:Fibronectin type III domain